LDIQVVRCVRRDGACVALSGICLNKKLALGSTQCSPRFVIEGREIVLGREERGFVIDPYVLTMIVEDMILSNGEESEQLSSGNALSQERCRISEPMLARLHQIRIDSVVRAHYDNMIPTRARHGIPRVANDRILRLALM